MCVLQYVHTGNASINCCVCDMKHICVMCGVGLQIALRCSDFRPETLLDFGSGVGTTVW